MFYPPRDRDACAAIRGYLYQIDRTVVRWLHLSRDENLELERGEYIDIVTQVLSANGGDVAESRLLEQIKQLEASITLRTAGAKEALANFFDHRRLNPHVKLNFCFLTNAEIGSEQLNPFPGRIPGLAYWEQVRTHALDEAESLDAVQTLRRFLTPLVKPDNFPEAVWKDWQRYLTTTTPQEFRTFIERFEWSTSYSAPETIPEELRRVVLTLGIVPEERFVQGVVDRLVVYVIRLLTTKGPKCLTVDDRERVLTDATILAAELQHLSEVRLALADHDTRLEKLEADVSAIFFGHATERVEFSLPVPDISPHQPVVRLSRRPSTVSHVLEGLDDHGWLALTGGPDTGKSQLTVQLIAHRGDCRGWLQFHHSQNALDAMRQLNAGVLAILGWPEVPRRHEWYLDAISLVGKGAVLVLDDLPRIAPDEPFAEHLIRFGQAAVTGGVKIVSTSQYELPSRIRHRLGTAKLCELPMPPFSDQEAADLFRAYEAPEVLQREGPIRFFNGLAAGHPLLLAAVAEFLAKHDWQHTNQEIESLLQGAHVVDLMPEVVGRLVRTVDIQPRDLLYRLTLPIGAFKHSDVMALAGVEPPIDRPGERLNAILGAWVQRSAGTGLAVSPLVKPLGKTELSPDVRKRCYRDLALRIVKKGSINQDEGESAILYSLEAHEFRMAVRLYVSSLIEALKAREELRKYIIPTIDKWRETALPQSLDVGTRLFVRAFQLAAFTKFGLDPTFVVHDIDALLSSASERDGWSIVGLAIHSLRGFRLVDPLRVIGYVRKAIELPRVVGPDGGGFEIEGLHLPDLLWMLVADLRTPALVEAWLDVVESLTHTDQEQFWNAKLAGEGVWLVANRVYMTEWKKPKTEQDWEGLLQFHRSMLHRVRPLKRAKLEAAFSVAMLEILGDQKRIAELTGVAEPVLARWPADPDVQFRVKGSWGRQCVPMGRCDLALSLIDAALAQPHSESDHARLRCLLQANMCVAEGDLRYIEEARDLARKSVRAPKIEVARAFGEYALSRLGSAPDHARALAIYPTWSEAMRKFFELDSKNEIWRDLAILFAHVTSYLTQFASEGAPPKETI